MSAGDRIAFDARYVNDRYHGIGRYAFRLLEGLVAMAPDREFVVFKGPGKDSRFDWSRLEKQSNIEFRSGPWPLYWPREQLVWPRSLRQIQVGLFFSPSFPAPLFSSVPQVITVHDLIFDRYPTYMPSRWARPYYRLLMKVAELDQLLSRALASSADGARETADVARSLHELAARIAPALAARGVSLALATEGAPRVAVDPHLVRRAALLLARAGADALVEGGALALGIAREPRRIGVSITLRAPKALAANDGWADEAEHFSWLHGGSLERDPSGFRAVLWLPASEGAWTAS